MNTPSININLRTQVLELRTRENKIKQYQVSTAANGAGEQLNSFCTPRGRHIIRAKIGGGAPLGSVFIARRPSGEIYKADIKNAAERDCQDRDWILTRILWLSGCETGKNRGGEVDTMRRYIYIHGAPDKIKMGIPGSNGCIRMRNTDVVELFDAVAVGTLVVIDE